MTTQPTGENPEGYWGPTRFEVGQPWPWEPEWVAERGFRWLPDSMLLLLVEDDVTEEMCEALTEPVDVALLGVGPLVGLLVRFGDMWGWAESMVWRRPDQGVPDLLTPGPDEGEHPHLLVRVVLVDSGSKLIRHMRAFTVSAHFTKRLYAEAAARWSTGTTPEEAQVAFADYERRYPTVEDALAGSLARSHAGD